MNQQTNTAGGATGCGSAFGKFGRSFQGKFPFPFPGGPGGPFGGMRRPKYNVPVNIAETDTAYHVQVYATGFDKENISLSVSANQLFISGTRSIDESNAPQFTRQEFPIKSFERVLELNDKIDAAGISAKQENGVLHITLPKTKEAQAPEQKIPVQ